MPGDFMPTKRRFLLFLIVLAVMLLIKYVVSQEPVGRRPDRPLPITKK